MRTDRKRDEPRSWEGFAQSETEILKALKEAYEKGWIVLRDHDVAETPVEISIDLPGMPAIKKFVFLSNDGWYGIED